MTGLVALSLTCDNTAVKHSHMKGVYCSILRQGRLFLDYDWGDFEFNFILLLCREWRKNKNPKNADICTKQAKQQYGVDLNR